MMGAQRIASSIARTHLNFLSRLDDIERRRDCLLVGAAELVRLDAGAQQQGDEA